LKVVRNRNSEIEVDTRTRMRECANSEKPF